MNILKFNFSFNALINLFLKLSYLFAISLFFLDFYFYSGFVSNNLVSPLIIAGIVLVTHLFIRFRFHQNLSPEFVRFNWLVLAPATILLALIAYYLEEYGLLFPNYFFTNFRFHYLALPYLALPALGFGVVHATKTIWQESWKQLVLLISVFLVIGAGFLFYFDNELYRTLTVEDGVVEYSTALGFFLSSILALLLTKKRNLFRNNLEKKIFVSGCILVGIAMFFVAGEEISWGQRLLGIETPEMIAEQNRQGEINLHNSELIWPYVYTAYFLIGFYGATMWILGWLSSGFLKLTKTQQLWKKLLIPGGYLFVLFGMICLYVWLRGHHGPWKYQLWEEYAELLLVLGMAIHLSEVYFSFPKRE